MHGRRTWTSELRRRSALVLQGYGPVADALAAAGLAGVADHVIEDLSGGRHQRVAVARALVTSAEVFLADEPTAELEGDNRALVVSLLPAPRPIRCARRPRLPRPRVIDVCDDVLDLGSPVSWDPACSLLPTPLAR